MVMQQSGKIEFVEVGLGISDLLCPRGGGRDLYHRGATFFERGEDDKQEVVIDVRGPKVSTAVSSAGTTGNPSRRRHGIIIHFDCAACTDRYGKIQMGLAQHKGSTEITWRFDPIPAPDC